MRKLLNKSLCLHEQDMDIRNYEKFDSVFAETMSWQKDVFQPKLDMLKPHIPEFNPETDILIEFNLRNRSYDYFYEFKCHGEYIDFPECEGSLLSCPSTYIIQKMCDDFIPKFRGADVYYDVSADIKFNKKVKKKYNFAKSHMKKFFDKDQIKEFTKISKKNYCDRNTCDIYLSKIRFLVRFESHHEKIKYKLAV